MPIITTLVIMREWSEGVGHSPKASRASII